MNIDPRIGSWCNFVALVLTGIAGGSIAFGHLPANIVDDIKTAAVDGLGLLTAANLVFHLYSAPTSGPMAKGN